MRPVELGVTDDEDAGRVAAEIAKLLRSGQAPLLVRIERAGERRSDAQNARMWAILGEIARQCEHEGERRAPSWWKLRFAAEFLKIRETRFPGGHLVHEISGTSDLDKAAFSDFVTQIEVWAIEHGVRLGDQEAA